MAALNDNCSPQNRRTEPKLVWLESSGHEDSDYVRISSMPVNEKVTQNVWVLFKKLMGWNEPLWAVGGPVRARIFSCLMEGETWGDLWLVQDFAHASIVIDQN